VGIQELLGHKEVRTTMVNTHVLNQRLVDELCREDQVCYIATL
jgi:site-specific recombinase XerD